MYFRKLILDGKARWYLFAGVRRLPVHLSGETPTVQHELEKLGRSRFFLYPSEKLLLKVRVDKRTPRNGLYWLGRIVSERVFLQNNARKEYQGARLYARAGLKTVGKAAWGVALNPLNRLGSIFVIDYLVGAVNGKDYFKQADDEARRWMIDEICGGVAKLAEQGYFNKDQHLGNILVDGGELFWIDTHVARLPLGRERRRRKLIGSLTYKLRIFPEHKVYAQSVLEKLLPSR